MKKKSIFLTNCSYFLLKLIGPVLDYAVSASYVTILLTHLALTIVCCIGVVAGFYAGIDVNICTMFGKISLGINLGVFLIRVVFKYKKEHITERTGEVYFKDTEFSYQPKPEE